MNHKQSFKKEHFAEFGITPPDDLDGHITSYYVDSEPNPGMLITDDGWHGKMWILTDKKDFKKLKKLGY